MKKEWLKDNPYPYDDRYVRMYMSTLHTCSNVHSYSEEKKKNKSLSKYDRVEPKVSIFGRSKCFLA